MWLFIGIGLCTLHVHDLLPTPRLPPNLGMLFASLGILGMFFASFSSLVTLSSSLSGFGSKIKII